MSSYQLPRLPIMEIPVCHSDFTEMTGVANITSLPGTRSPAENVYCAIAKRKKNTPFVSIWSCPWRKEKAEFKSVYASTYMAAVSIAFERWNCAAVVRSKDPAVAGARMLEACAIITFVRKAVLKNPLGHIPVLFSPLVNARHLEGLACLAGHAAYVQREYWRSMPCDEMLERLLADNNHKEFITKVKHLYFTTYALRKAKSDIEPHPSIDKYINSMLRELEVRAYTAVLLACITPNLEKHERVKYVRLDFKTTEDPVFVLAHHAHQKIMGYTPVRDSLVVVSVLFEKVVAEVCMSQQKATEIIGVPRTQCPLTLDQIFGPRSGDLDAWGEKLSEKFTEPTKDMDVVKDLLRIDKTNPVYRLLKERT